MKLPFTSKPGATRHLGWGRLLDGGRAVPAFAVVAVVCLLLGMGLARFVQPTSSTGSAASLTAGPITAEVQRTSLRNAVVARADARFADAVTINAPTSGFEGAAIVTGTLPAVGSHVEALSVPVEVSGRPIIVLPGAIPAYRTLSFGLHGADVLELKAALVSVHINPGNASSDLFDAATARAVGQLYQRVGYEPVSGAAAAEDALRAAQDAVGAEQRSLQSAQRALAAAKQSVTPQARIEQANAVNAATRAEQSAQRALSAVTVEASGAASDLSAAQAELAARQAAGDDDTAARAAVASATAHRSSAVNAQADAADALANAHENTALAIATRDAALATPNTDEQAANVTAAQSELDSALASQASLRNAALPLVPLGEVAFLSDLPRRVDTVTGTVGGPASGPLLTLSGAQLALVALVSTADAALVTIGDEATFVSSTGGAAVKARVIAIDTVVADTSKDAASSNGQGAGAAAAKRMAVTLTPIDLSDSEVKELNGANVRVTIPVGATARDVLTVPIAAVSVGPGGASRVEVLAAGGRSSFVDVTTGLAAEGEVEVHADAGVLTAGDHVVVGR